MDAKQNATGPKIFISAASHLRLNALTKEFTDVLLGEIVGETADPVEQAQIPVARKLVPNADDTMALIVARLITHFVRDPAQLITVMNERHVEAISTYGWIVPSTEEEIQAQQAAGAIEGASIFWLSFAQNDYLLNQEALLRPAYAPTMFNNRWQHLAIRGLLRLQSILFDMSQLSAIETLHAMHWEGKVITASYAPSVPKRDEDEQSAAASEAPAAAKPAIN